MISRYGRANLLQNFMPVNVSVFKFLKLRFAYSNKKLVFYYDFKIRKGEFVAKFHACKRLRF